MKLTTLAFATATATLAAAEGSRREVRRGIVQRRDVATIDAAITDLTNKAAAFATALEGFTAANATSLTNLNAAGTALVRSFHDDVGKVSSTANITVGDTLSLTSPVATLQSTANTMVADLTAKKPEAEKAGLCDVMHTTTVNIATGLDDLAKAILSKVPPELAAIAASQVQAFVGTLQSASTVYASSNCTNKVSPPSTSTGPPAGGSANGTSSKSASPPGVKPTKAAVGASIGALALAFAAMML